VQLHATASSVEEEAWPGAGSSLSVKLAPDPEDSLERAGDDMVELCVAAPAITSSVHAEASEEFWGVLVDGLSLAEMIDDADTRI